MTLPLTVVIAQRYVAPELWVPFMNAVAFVTGVSAFGAYLAPTSD